MDKRMKGTEEDGALSTYILRTGEYVQGIEKRRQRIQTKEEDGEEDGKGE